MAIFTRLPVIKHYDHDMSKRWHIEYYDENNERQQVRDGKPYGIVGDGNRYKTKKARLDFFEKLLLAVTTNQQPKAAPNKQLLVTAVADFLVYKKQTVNHKTMTDYKSRVTMFSDSVPKIALSKVKETHIYEHLNRKTMSSTNYNNDLRTINLFFKWCVSEKLITENPAAKLKNRSGGVTNNLPFGIEDATRILANLKEIDHSLYVCCNLEYYAFIRPKEIGLMSWTDFDFQANTIKVRGAISKNKKTRVIPMHHSLKSVLLEQNVSNYFDKNFNADYYKTKWSRCKAQLDVPIGRSLYTFKRDGCCNLYRATKDIRLVSRLCGHSTTTVTETYLRDMGELITNDEISLLPTL